MSRQHQHSHPCSVEGCKQPVVCMGTWERNHDGFPQTICSDYHLPNGRIAEVACDEHTCSCGKPVAVDEHGRAYSSCHDCADGGDDPFDLAMPFAENH